MMNEQDLKWILVRGLDIKYNESSIKQPTIKDIDSYGLLNYFSFTYPYCITKENLGLSEEFLNDLKNYTLFQTFFIYDDLLRKSGKWKEENSLIANLYKSLLFFLNIQDVDRLKIGECCFIVSNDENIPIWKLDDENFEEFCELIRLVTCSEVIKIEKEENDELEHYEDVELQRLIEEQYKIYKEDKKKEQKENEVSISEIIGSICMNENSKYDFNNIGGITMWQLHYYFSFLSEKENIEITKSQFTSGNYNFEKVPDLNWIKKTKVKLQKCNKLISE